jgi:alpha-D-ribose 1-methylphosphonate 5-triphosphate synthase subunit PhnL
MDMASTHLGVHDLSKSFELHILHGKQIVGFEHVSFTVPRGAFVGIAGQSGSGKSSLLKCLYRTYLADSGEILFQAPGDPPVDLVTAPDDVVLDLREREIGYVSQFLRPTPRVTALDLAIRPMIRRGLARDEAHARVAGLFGTLALPEDLWDGFPVLFSGGEQQRVNLARALVGDAPMLLLDEPTSALDASLQDVVVQLLAERRDQGTTMVGIMHDATLLRQLSDVLLHMEQGRLVGIETIGDRLMVRQQAGGDLVGLGRAE